MTRTIAILFFVLIAFAFLGTMIRTGTTLHARTQNANAIIAECVR